MTYNEIQIKLIQSIIHQPEMISEIQKKISLEDFSNERLRDIYKAITDYTPKGEEFTESEFHDALLIANIQEQPGDMELLFPVEDPPLVLAKLLKKESVISNAQNVLEESISHIKTNPVDIGGNIADLQHELDRLSVRLVETEEKTIAEQTDDFMEYIKTEKSFGIPSMLPDLDRYTSGWRPGQLITVAARTGIGKSVFATNCAVSALEQGKSVLFFSLEMTASQLITRMIAAREDVRLSDMDPLKKSETGDGYDKEIYDKVMRSSNFIKNSKLIIDSTYESTIEYIKGKSKEISKSENGLDMIIIDYIQLINPSGKYHSRQEQVADISRSLKVLAKELNVPIMVVAQLKRNAGTQGEEEDELPSKDDIRESGAIAQDSDIVVIIHRKYRDDSPIKKAQIILDKNRDGVADRIIHTHAVLEKSIFKPLKTAEKEIYKEDNSINDNEEQKDINTDDIKIEMFDGIEDEDDDLIFSSDDDLFI